jgi:SAM-dependent methyltransferase
MTDDRNAAASATHAGTRRGQWPKIIAPLTAEQRRIANEFQALWLEQLPKRYGAIERFNHGFPARNRPARSPSRTLEIGAGRGEHLRHEDLAGQEYHCVELKEGLAQEITSAFPNVAVKIADCQANLPYPDAHFDRVNAIHVLEHLPNLPAALDQVHRVLRDDGRFVVVIPCDPGALYRVARWVSAERMFRKRYRQSYDWYIRQDHVNTPGEILDELAARFMTEKRSFFPFLLPFINLNLCIGLVLRKRPQAETVAAQAGSGGAATST